MGDEGCREVSLELCVSFGKKVNTSLKGQPCELLVLFLLPELYRVGEWVFENV